MNSLRVDQKDSPRGFTISFFQFHFPRGDIAYQAEREKELASGEGKCVKY